MGEQFGRTHGVPDLHIVIAAGHASQIVVPGICVGDTLLGVQAVDVTDWSGITFTITEAGKVDCDATTATKVAVVLWIAIHPNMGIEHP